MDNAIRPDTPASRTAGASPGHKQLVRSHPHPINKRLRGGLREIDPQIRRCRNARPAAG